MTACFLLEYHGWVFQIDMIVSVSAGSESRV